MFAMKFDKLGKVWKSYVLEKCNYSNESISLFRDAAPIVPSDTKQGYKQMKARIGSSKVRPWKWMPFTNPARKVSENAFFFLSQCFPKC